MSRLHSPPEKKAARLQKDRRNTYGENSKSSRKNIPRAKVHEHHKARRGAHQDIAGLRGVITESFLEDVQAVTTKKSRPHFRKTPDEPLGSVVTRKLQRRKKLGMQP